MQLQGVLRIFYKQKFYEYRGQLTFDILRDYIQQKFKNLPQNYEIIYHESQTQTPILRNDEDLKVLYADKRRFLRLQIKEISSQLIFQSKPKAITCAKCKKENITINYYSCIVCKDYGLCFECENTTNHQHPLLKIKDPSHTSIKVFSINEPNRVQIMHEREKQNPKLENAKQFVSQLNKVLESKDRIKVDYEKAELYLLRFLAYLKDRNQWIDDQASKKKEEHIEKKAQKNEDQIKKQTILPEVVKVQKKEQENLRSIHMESPSKTQKSQERQPGQRKIQRNPNIHMGVQCRQCKALPMVGVRYKCAVCENYDLCKSCEGKAQHEHPLLKIRSSVGRPIKSYILLESTLDNIYDQIQKGRDQELKGQKADKQNKNPEENEKVNQIKVDPLEFSMKKSQQLQKKKQYSQNISCEECSKSIVGVRYKCARCDNYNICAGCEKNSKHQHPFLKIKKSVNQQVKVYMLLEEELNSIYDQVQIDGASQESQESQSQKEEAQKQIPRVQAKKQQVTNYNVLAGDILHSNIVCKQCKAQPIIGHRFKCTRCENYDLCSTCEKKTEHDHAFLKIKKCIDQPIKFYLLLQEQLIYNVTVVKKSLKQKSLQNQSQKKQVEQGKILDRDPPISVSHLLGGNEECSQSQIIRQEKLIINRNLEEEAESIQKKEEKSEPKESQSINNIKQQIMQQKQEEKMESSIENIEPLTKEVQDESKQQIKSEQAQQLPVQEQTGSS